jgi:hypothetical protein
MLVGLPWMAGHLAFTAWDLHSLILALAFSVAAWGALRLGSGLARGSWLMNTGLVASAVLLVAVRQPLAAGIVGLLLFGQMTVQLALRLGHRADVGARRTWPWLMLCMLVAALAVA